MRLVAHERRRVAKPNAARVHSAVLGSALALSFVACSIRIPASRTCYREEVRASSLEGTVALASPTLSASGDVLVAPSYNATPQNLGVGFGIQEGASGVGQFAIRFIVGATAQHSRGVTLATLRVASLPMPGSYPMPSIGCVASCPTTLPVIDNGSCVPESTDCAPNDSNDCDAGAPSPDAEAGSPDAGVVAPLACVGVDGTLVVRGNTTADCRSDNTHIEGQEQTQVCTTDFDATLTFSTAATAGTQLSGTFAIHYRQEVGEYECGSLND